MTNKKSYSLKELIDLKKLQRFTDTLHAAFGIPSAVITTEGEILTGSGWQKICTDFHRANPETEKDCIDSDTKLHSMIEQGNKYCIYKCPHGLIDSCAPVIIEGEHLANVFTGQFFPAPPTEEIEAFFRDQAKRFDFDEDAYMSAFREVPVFAEDKHRVMLEVLLEVATLMGDIGLMRKREIEETKKLQISEANLERAQRISKVGDFTWSIQTGKVTWSQGMYYLLKYDVDKEIDLEKVNADIHHPEDLEKVTKWLTGSIESGIDELVPYEYRLVCKNGEIIYVQTNGRIEYENNVAVKLFGTCTDISERKKTEEMLKESEERYRVLFDSSPDGILVADKVSRKFLYANQSICDLLGYSESELTGMSVLDIHPKKSLDYVLDEFELQASAKKLVAENIPCQKKDGSIVMVDINTVMIVLNEVKCMIGFFRDITERKLTEEELLRARKLESVGLLAGGIAHDFNNILTGLFGNMELAKRELTSDHAAHSYIENADQALDRATGLTKQLLTFAKGGDPILEVINIGQIIEDSIKFSLSGSNVKTSINVQADLWHVKADKGQLSQVITNLVINAKQAMPDGGVLTIETKNIMDCTICFTNNIPRECVRLTIRDEGTGISRAYLEKIFDPYFTTKQTGSGLGLTTVHSIISKHNGHINVDSELGVGSTFTIHLQADRSTPQSAETTFSDMTEKSDPISGRVLVMDDDEMILNLTTEIIKSFGYTVDTAIDGKVAIEKYISAEKSAKPFDVVIMDLTIPGGMGGKEAVQEFLAINPEAKVIVSSGYSTDPVMANYREYGFKGRLVKPFQMDELQKELFLQISSE